MPRKEMNEYNMNHNRKLGMLGVLLLLVGAMRYLNFSWAHVLMAVGIVLILKSLMKN